MTNLLEFAGAAAITAGIYLLAGLAWALIAGGSLLLASAEIRGWATHSYRPRTDER